MKIIHRIRTPEAQALAKFFTLSHEIYLAPLVLTTFFFVSTHSAQAQIDTSRADSTPIHTPSNWNSHFQWTSIIQEHAGFSAPYSGSNSLQPGHERRLSITSTLFFGEKLWKNAEGYLNIELGGGGGLSNALGIAGFPNGEVYRIGDPAPVIYPARVYLRQTFPLASEEEELEDAPNQLPGLHYEDKVVLTAGKFSLTDYFDNNRFSHDPRTQFMNWSIMSMGAWDYAADTRGYTWGALAELIRPAFEARFAAVMVPTSANGPDFDHNIGKAYSFNGEVVQGFTLLDEPGRVHFVGYLNKANMGNYLQALSLGDSVADIIKTRTYNSIKYGGGISLEQSINANIGFFSRYSWNDGHTETWAFTEIDRSFQFGFQFQGDLWKRTGDCFGVAAVYNSLSPEHRTYLAAGGLGFIIGDGALSYATESIYELYYSAHFTSSLTISADYQMVLNPAYNQDRPGPIHIFALRGHFAM